MRLPRFTTRRLIVLVAGVALPLALFAELRRRHENYARLAHVHLRGWGNGVTRAAYLRGQRSQYYIKARSARKFAMSTSSIASGKPKPITVNGVEVRWGEVADAHARDASAFEVRSAQLAREARECQQLADRHKNLYLKYRRAARYPWLPVPPDPPMPK